MHWKKSLYTLHGWMGLNFGLVLFIICLSGTFAVVSHEIDWLLTPTMRVTPGASRATYGEMHDAVRAAYPDVPIQSAWAPQGSRFACEFWVRGPSGGNRRVYVDPYTAKVLGEGSWFNSQRFFRDFHRRFFCGAWWGIWLVAVYGFVLVAASATGLAFYRRWWAKLFTLRWRSGTRVWFADLHRMLGVWTLLFSLLIGITGVWYFAEIPLGWKIKEERLPRLPESSQLSKEESLGNLPVDAWVKKAQQSIPELEVGTIWFPSTRSAARIEGQATAWLVRDRANQVLIDPTTGEVLHHQRAEQLSPYWRWVDSADPLHFGNFAGLTSKIIWFVLGLMLSLLMPTGAYLWTRRAGQIATGTQQRLQRSTHALTEAEQKYLIQRAVGRHTLFGMVTTTAILLLATDATIRAVMKQADAGGTEAGLSTWWHLGGPGAVAVYGGFSLVIVIATLVWYRWIWIARRAERSR